MITLTMKEQKRLGVMQRVFGGELSVEEAALVLGVCERQAYRIKAGIRKKGVTGVVHGNRGCPCKRKVPQKTVKRIVELARGKYRGFNDHHLSEKQGGREDRILSGENPPNPTLSRDLELARNMQRKAQFFLDFVEAENSTGFHAPQEAARILAESINFSRLGQLALRNSVKAGEMAERKHK